MDKWFTLGSSSMSLMGDTFTEQAAKYGAVHFSGGLGGDNGPAILARCGVMPYTMAGVATVPANGSEVNCQVYPNPLAAGGETGTDRDIPVTIAVDDVDHALILRTSSSPRHWVVRQAAAGNAVTVPDGAKFYADVHDDFRDAVLFLNIGKNSVSALTAGKDLAEYNYTAWKWAADFSKRVVVIGQFVNRGHTPDTPQFLAISIWNEIDAERYGKYFISFMDYLLSDDPWQHTSYTKMPEDSVAIAQGMVPPSFLTQDGAHLQLPVYRAFVRMVVIPHIINLGWYRSV